jgi:hypothetical protein
MEGRFGLRKRGGRRLLGMNSVVVVVEVLAVDLVVEVEIVMVVAVVEEEEVVEIGIVMEDMVPEVDMAMVDLVVVEDVVGNPGEEMVIGEEEMVEIGMLEGVVEEIMRTGMMIGVEVVEEGAVLVVLDTGLDPEGMIGDMGIVAVVLLLGVVAVRVGTGTAVMRAPGEGRVPAGPTVIKLGICEVR